MLPLSFRRWHWRTWVYSVLKPDAEADAELRAEPEQDEPCPDGEEDY